MQGSRGGREAVAGGQRTLLAVRLATDELLIATDQQVVAAGRMQVQGWGLTWSVRYTRITSFTSDEQANPPGLRLGIRGRERVLECRQLSGQTARDCQGKLHEALLAIVERRTRRGQGEGEHEPESENRRDPAAPPSA